MLATGALLTLLSWSARAAAASSWSPTLLVNTEAFQVIDDSSSANLVLKFGATVNKTLTYDRTATAFRFNDDVYITGTLSGTVLKADATLASSGTLVFEGAGTGNSLYIAQSLTGVGLVDCDTGATSKLLWDSATGRFSCGTDQSGGSVPEVGTESFSGGVIVIGDSRYVLTQGDTMTGGLTIDGQTDQVQLNVQADDAQSGNIVDIENYDSTSNYMTIDAGGATQFFGNVTLGDSSMDTAVFNAYVGSSILPSSDNTYDLGGGSNRWGNIYGNNGYFYLANATYMNGTFGTFGNATISGTTNCNGASVLATDISGNVYCDTDNDTLASFGITDGGTTETVDQGETITFSDGTDINVAVSPTNTVSVAFTNATGYITAAGVPGAETDPEYSANTYAIDMNQNVGTDDSPSHPGITLSSMTQGSVVFAGASGVLSQDNAMFFWDDSSDRMGIGTATPDRRLEVLDPNGNPQMRLTFSDSSSYVDFSVDTYGDFTVTPTGANTTFTGNVTIGALTNCDTIDTDGSGNLSCGTDDSGASDWSGTGALQTAFDTRYVNVAGDTMTGALTVDIGTLGQRDTGTGVIAYEKIRMLSGAMLSGSLLFTAGRDMPKTGSGDIHLFAKEIAGREMLRARGPNGLGASLQPALFEKNIMILTPGGGTTVNGYGTTVTNDTTVSHPTPIETFGYMSNFATSTTSADDAGTSTATSSVFRGANSGSGGFFFSARIGTIENTSIRVFSGLANQTIATMVGGNDPAGHHIGFQFSTPRTDTNWQFESKDGSTQAVTDTGMPYRSNHVYDQYFYCSDACTTVFWRLDNVTLGTSAEGSVTSNLPGVSTAMRMVLGVETQTTAARNIRMQKMYVESDR